MTSRLDQETSEHEMYAHGFVYGRESMGDRSARDMDSSAFASAYAESRRACKAGEIGSAPSIDRAYENWQATGSVNPRTRGNRP